MQPTVNHVAPVFAEAQAWQAVDRLFISAEGHQRNALEELRQAGALLSQLKAHTPKGQWEQVVEQKCRHKLRMVQCVIQLNENWALLGSGKKAHAITLHEALWIIREIQKEARGALQCASANAATIEDVPDFGNQPSKSSPPSDVSSAPPGAPPAKSPGAPQKEREPGDDYEAEGEAGAPETEEQALKRLQAEIKALREKKAAERTAQPRPAKNGEPEFNLSEFSTMARSLVLQLTRLARHYGLKINTRGENQDATTIMTPQQRAIERRIQELIAGVETIMGETRSWRDEMKNRKQFA